LWDIPPLQSVECDDTDVAGRHRQRTSENYNITVCARIKPNAKYLKQPESDKVTLPLHQRLALIRLSNNLDTNKDALNVLVEQGDWFGYKWSETNRKRTIDGSSGYEKENIDERHKKDEGLHCLREGIHTVDTEAHRVVVVDPMKGIREFDFDNVFDDFASQDQVYESSTRRLVCDFINGFNGTCFVYGQTGSGKTFTMFGPSIDRNIRDKDKGIVPRVCEEVLEALEYRRENINYKIDASISVSYIEIYGNDVSDLLKQGASCGHNRASAQRYVLEGAADVPIQSTDDVFSLLRKGESQKRKAATAMNERSTRAHSLFIITLQQYCDETGTKITSKLFLVDLGGSEKTKKSRVEAGVSKHIEDLKQKTLGGQWDFEEGEAKQSSNGRHDEVLHSTGFVKSDRMREAVYINLGLMALKSCVEALNSENPNAHVPYGNSKLTMLLSSGLGGNSKTSVVVCAAQEKEHTAETIAALKFGQSCSRVSNSARTGMNAIHDLISNLDAEIANCEAIIQKNERWEVNEETRVDSLAEEGTVEAHGFKGIEVRKTTVLVGAEKERKRLYEMIQKRAELTGTTLESKINGEKFGGSLGFGNANVYGLGNKFDARQKNQENYRFTENIDLEDLPSVLRTRGHCAAWKTGESLDGGSDSVSQQKMTKKRSKLAYSGISA